MQGFEEVLECKAIFAMPCSYWRGLLHVAFSSASLLFCAQLCFLYPLPGPRSGSRGHSLSTIPVVTPSTRLQLGFLRGRKREQRVVHPCTIGAERLQLLVIRRLQLRIVLTRLPTKLLASWRALPGSDGPLAETKGACTKRSVYPNCCFGRWICLLLIAAQRTSRRDHCGPGCMDLEGYEM